MTLLLETGYGVRGANSYALASYVTAYLTARNRQTEGSWSTLSSAAMDAHCIAATSYIDKRWGVRFEGLRQYVLDGRAAQGQVSFSGQPSPSDTVTVGATVYTFVASLSTFATGEVLIGATLADTIDNLVAAVGQADGSGTTYSALLEQNREALAAESETVSDAVVFTARQEGESGNDIALTVSGANLTVDSVLVGGLDPGPQPLEFPRTALYTPSGQLVIGIPGNLKDAVAEYAVRSAVAVLDPDPDIDDALVPVQRKREKVGPIEEEVEYAAGGVPVITKPYPAADRLLRDYVGIGEGAYR